MRLAHTPLHRIVPGDRVVSRTGLSGRVGAVYRAGDPAPIPSDEGGTLEEPRILILWESGRWTLAEHHMLDTVSHDIKEPQDALVHGAPPRPLPSRAQRLADGLRAILADIGPDPRAD